MEKIDKFAPVLIPTLNRNVHFKRCVESLAKCTHADKTDLYIALDYPLNDSHWEGYNLLKEYLPGISGFKSVTVYERKANYGVRRNIDEARNLIFKKYDRLIMSEDDNVFALTFLEFVNRGLVVYEDRDDIFAVTGYNSPFEMPEWYKEDVYLSMTFTVWGMGIWKNKWNQIDWSMENYISMFNKRENMKILKNHYRRHLPQLTKIKETGVITGDGFILLNNIDKKLYGVVPVETRVRNTGHDGSGLHCNVSPLYLNQKIKDGNTDTHMPKNLQPDEQLLSYLKKKYIQLPLAYRILLISGIIRFIPAKAKKTILRIFPVGG